MTNIYNYVNRLSYVMHIQMSSVYLFHRIKLRFCFGFDDDLLRV